MRRITMAILGLMLMALSALASPALAKTAPLPGEKLVQIPSRPGITISVYALGPPGAPGADVIIFPGGDGIIGTQGDNFLLRTRAKYAAAGFLVVSVGMPSDHKDGLTAKTRSTPEYAQDIAAVIAWIRQKNNKPIWLIGTSTGTISAANVASRLTGAAGPHGLIMTSTFVPPPSTNAPPIYTWVDLSAIAIPTLFVHNKEDGCRTSPFTNLQPLIDKVNHAPKKELITVSGGLPPTSEPCDALSRHGYLGLEDQVVGSIVNWIKAN